MGKNSPSRVLKTVFQDISNVEDVIKESKKIEKSCKKVNFDDQKEVEKIFADTKTIVDTLKDKVLQIDVYFDEKYQTWKSKLPTTPITESEIKDSNNSQNTDKPKDKAKKDKRVEKSTEKDSNDSTNTVNDAGEKRAKKDKLVTEGSEKDLDSNDSHKTVNDASEKQAKEDKLVKKGTEKGSDSNNSLNTVYDAGEKQAKKDKLVKKGTEKDSDSSDSPSTADVGKKQAKKDKLVKKGTGKDSDSNDSPNTVDAGKKQVKKDKLVKKGSGKDLDSNDSPNTVDTDEKQGQDKLLNKTIERDSDGKDSPSTVSDASEKQLEKEKLIEEGTEKDSDSNNSPVLGEENVEDKPTEGAKKVSDSCNTVDDTCVEQAQKDKSVEEGTEKDSSSSIVNEQAENKSPEEDTEKEAAENKEIMEESDSSSKSRKNKSKRSKKNKSDRKRNEEKETENTEVAEQNGSESQNDVTNKCDSNSEGAAESLAEQKVFLKCVDIKKLVKPDILPQLKSPSPTRNNGFNDSILIISDSDQETEANDKQKKTDKNSKSNEEKVKSERKVGRNLRNRENVAQKNRFADLKLKHQTLKQKSESLVIIDSDSDSKQNKSEHHKKDNKEKFKSAKKSKKEVESASTDDNSKSRSRKKNKDSSRKRPRDLQDQAKESLSDTSSGNDSDGSIVTSKKSVQKNRRVVKEKTINFTEKEKRTLDAQSDKKFTYKAYVSLPEIRCEKLKEYYLKTKELKDIKRLTNLDTLKKKRSRKNRSLERSDQGTSSDVENIKPKPKRKRKTSKGSHVSNAESSDDEPNTHSSPSTTKEPESTKAKPTTDQLDDQGVKMMLDGINSGTDASEKESETEEDGTKKKSKKADKKSESSKKSDEKKKDKQSDESANSTDAEKKKEKSKWQKDKLLTSKISDSDSEDEFVKFKKRNEKAKDDCRARLCKKKKKVVISSDSGSDSDRKKKKKKDSGDEFEPSKQKDSSSSSSSSSESEKEDKKEEEENDTKKRRRIKRVKESSSDEDDKTTRKTIRRVIGHESLAEATKQAEKDEKERKARIAERQKKYNKIFDEEKPEDATVDKVVLDFNEESKEEILVVNEDLVKKLKPHQAKGVQFMWDACFESVERTKKTEGSGCILAHCMGLGKTLQVIALVHTLIVHEELTGVKKVLVVCPVNTVLNWVAEFTKWLDDIEGPDVDVYELTTLKQYPERQYTVKQWMKYGGALVIGYDMFRNFTNPNNKRIRKSIRDTFQEGLVNPGPDLVVCDEGHLLKNEKTNLSIAMNRIRSVRRIVLTGTPMQNNLKEYYCMVQFVKQNLLGTYKEYLNRFVNPITNGQYTDSTQHDIQIMRKRSHVLHKLLDGIVQRKDYSVLAPFLPPKHEYVLFLTLSEVQIKLYQHYKDHYSQRPIDNKVRSTTFLFMDFQEFQRICTHPRVLLNKSEENKKKAIFRDDSEEESEGSLKDFIDDDESEAKTTSSSSSGSDSDSSKSDKSVKSKENKKKTDSKKRMTRNSAAAAGIDVEEMTLENQKAGEENEWWRQYCDGEELDNIAHSSKLYLLFQILQECELIGDKLLVFSQSLYSLTIIEYFLAQIDEATQKGDNDKVCGFSGSWALGLDYFRLDGSSSCDNRATWCKRFNSPDNPRARLFLISTKAGGLGINLVGANRVIIFDVSWNPSHDIQSIYRVYRFGQTKPCYIYRFVTYGTMEMKIYERQVTKQAISKRVIDEQQIDRHYNQTDLAELYNFDPKPDEQPIPLVPKDVLLGELLQKEKDRIYKYHEHQSLLENKEDEELDEAERKAAWEEFENEKTIRVNNNMGWIKNLPIASIQAALVNIVQKDNPGWTRDQIQKVVPMILQQLRAQVDEGQMLLFNRVVTEIRIMQVAQQQKMQEYFMRQQMQLLQRYQGQANVAQLAGLNYSNPLQAALAGQSIPTSSNEIVELND